VGATVAAAGSSSSSEFEDVSSPLDSLLTVAGDSLVCAVKNGETAGLSSSGPGKSSVWISRVGTADVDATGGCVDVGRYCGSSSFQ